MRRTQRHRSCRDAELNGLQVSVDNLQVTREDFGQALSEVRPSFGASLDDLDRRDTPETRARCGRDAAERCPRYERDVPAQVCTWRGPRVRRRSTAAAGELLHASRTIVHATIPHG